MHQSPLHIDLSYFNIMYLICKLPMPVNSNEEHSDVYRNIYEPGGVMVLYKRGTVTQCKICHANGEWSKFASASQCESSVAFRKANRTVSTAVSRLSSQATAPCKMKDLTELESSSSSSSRSQRGENRKLTDGKIDKYNFFGSNWQFLIL